MPNNPLTMNLSWTVPVSDPSLVYEIWYSSGGTIAISNVAVTSNVATITANNSFSVGQSVVIAGLTNTVLNGTWIIASSSPTNFTFSLINSNISSTPDVGTATFLAPFQLLAKISGIQSYNFVPVLNNFYSLKVRSVNLFGTSAFSNLVQLSATPGGGGARLGGGDLN